MTKKDIFRRKVGDNYRWGDGIFMANEVVGHVESALLMF